MGRRKGADPSDLRAGFCNGLLDLEHLAEKTEDFGRSHRHACESLLEPIIKRPRRNGLIMWPDLPLEFNVVGTPVSFQSDNARAKQDWRASVLAAAQRTIEAGSWAFDSSRLSVTMLYFPQAPMPGDLDNIVKLILDALKPNIYIDDSLIDRLLIQRFDPAGTYSFDSPSDTLVAAMAIQDPVLYIKVVEVSLEDIAP